MSLPKSFVFRTEAYPQYEHLATVVGDRVSVQWHPEHLAHISSRGNAVWKESHISNVESWIENSGWIIVRHVPDGIEARIAYFQVHIDALEENLTSLQQAFDVLKQFALKKEIHG
jgi:hypothetical protein